MKNYCIVGTGNRGIGMFGTALAEKYKNEARITGLCDNNKSRLKYAQEKLGKDISCYTDFDIMLGEVACDVVIVCSRDDTHHEYIVKALYAGKDVITEKPMTIDDGKCRQILKAEKESGKKIYVTFNYRFIPYAMKIKELLDSGAIGDVYSIDFHWYLDTVHGADYYRRWHRHKENSGGLMVHKSTHHFDLINWLIRQDPESVYANGSRNFYGDCGVFQAERCKECAKSTECCFYLELEKDSWLKEIYLDNEEDDGYYRDRCVFDPEINIEDTMSVLVKYSGGAQMNYSLVSFAPFEGWSLAINGSKGRLEAFLAEAFLHEETVNYTERESVQNRKPYDWRFTKDDDNRAELTYDEIRIYPLYGGVQSIKVERASGGHGGGDDRLRDLLFLPDAVDDKGIMAGSRAGAMSILVGIAANYSIRNKQPVLIADLLKDSLEHADCYGQREIAACSEKNCI